MGVDILFNWDHFFPLYGESDGEHFESWTELASWAELTSRVEFGALVNCNSYRNADLQADMARTIDHISGGRFIFGTGSGWFERDYDEYGYEFGTVGSRLDDLAEALPRIEARWAKLNPAPIRDIPILIGGAGEKKTLRLVAQYADIWHNFVSAEDLPRKLGILQGHCDAVGRDISEIELSSELSRTSLAEADALRALGATLFTVGLNGPAYDAEKVRPWLAWRDAQNA
jgi:probable F420-dependent oxidoreductase